MAAPTLVDRRIEHGARFVADLDDAGVPVDSAFWLFDSTWDEWRLVIATPIVDQSGPVEAYRRLQAVHSADESISFRLESVTAVGTEDRLVQAVRSQFRTWPLSLGKRFEDRFIRGGEVEDSYVFRVSPPPTIERAALQSAGRVRNGRH
jgi:hypothetical protein